MVVVGQRTSRELTQISEDKDLAVPVYTSPQMQEIEWESVPTDRDLVQSHSSYALRPLMPATICNHTRGVEDVRWYLPDFP
jgi:hypothetical protein